MFMDNSPELAGSPQETALHKLWSRRPTLSTCHLEDSDVTLLEDLFPSAAENDGDSGTDKLCSPCKSNCCQSAPATRQCSHHDGKTQEAYTELDASLLGDLPARYVIPVLASYEYPVVGIWVDPGIVPGFRYRVRPIQEQGQQLPPSPLFEGRALTLQSIGRGYSKRLTFQPDPASLNHNNNYFWSDSRPSGFAFEIEVLSVGDKFTLHDANHVASGSLEVVRIAAAQQEVSHVLLPGGAVEKTVRAHVLGKVEWFEEGQATVVLPVSGLVVAVKPSQHACARVSRVTDVQVGTHHRRGFSLTPGVSDKCRRTVVQGRDIGDVPAKYTIIGLEPHELPVIGTYVDPRITPGFTYRVRPCGSDRRLFSGRPLRLTGVGPGYGKRLTFAPDPRTLNAPGNHLWSDSHPEGLGFEPRAVHAGMVFIVTAGGQRLGEASVFRADAAQQEERHDVIQDSDGTVTITKRIHIDVTCHVTLQSSSNEARRPEAQVMRVSGTAVVTRHGATRHGATRHGATRHGATRHGATRHGVTRHGVATLVRVENVGLDSQLNLLFVTQQAELVFYPLC